MKKQKTEERQREHHLKYKYGTIPERKKGGQWKFKIKEGVTVDQLYQAGISYPSSCYGLRKGYLSWNSLKKAHASVVSLLKEKEIVL